MLKLSESSWGIEEIEAIQRCIESDAYTMGEAVAAFELEFASWIGSRYAVMVNSGSSANLLAAASISFLAGPKPKGKVIVPALSWSTTYFPWIQMGYELIFIDIDKNSFNLNISQIEEVIDENVSGICVPHILGSNAGISKIKSIADNYEIWLVEDTCESLGATAIDQNHLKKLGTFGDIGTYSFFRSHHICTMEGGMLVTDDFDTFAVAKSLRAHGWGRAVPESKKLKNSAMDVWKSNFTFYTPGFNLRPLEMSGRIGLEQLKKLDNFINYRRLNANFLKSKMKSISGIRLQEQDENGSWMAFAFVLESSDQRLRNIIVEELASLEIETRPIVTGNFVNQPVISSIKDKVTFIKNYDNAQYVDDYGFMVANHGRDLSKEIEVLTNLFTKFF
jgi:dTDP-4-amino-4,6-dideoxygalactose transaminase